MRWIKILFGLIVAAGMVKFLQLALTVNVGAWDAWAIWNLKAKFILAGSSNIFAPEIAYSHQDYPLLLPALVAAGWRVTGGSDQVIPALWAFVFTWGTVTIFYTAASRLQPVFVACLFTLVLILTRDFITTGAGQIADVPLACVNLGSVAAMTLYSRNKKVIWLALVATCAGAGLNMKNEGALFLLCFGVIYSIPLLKSGRGLAVFGLALLPWLAAFLYFKLNVAPANDVINTGTSLSQLFDFSRHRLIISEFTVQLSVLLLGLVSVLCLARLYLPFRLVPVRPLFLFLLMLAGYYCIYLLTPLDLAYHLGSSLNRLLVQIWPIALFGVIVSITGRNAEPAVT